MCADGRKFMPFSPSFGVNCYALSAKDRVALLEQRLIFCPRMKVGMNLHCDPVLHLSNRLQLVDFPL